MVPALWRTLRCGSRADRTPCATPLFQLFKLTCTLFDRHMPSMCSRISLSPKAVVLTAAQVGSTATLVSGWPAPSCLVTSPIIAIRGLLCFIAVQPDITLVLLPPVSPNLALQATVKDLLSIKLLLHKQLTSKKPIRAFDLHSNVQPLWPWLS